MLKPHQPVLYSTCTMIQPLLESVIAEVCITANTIPHKGNDVLDQCKGYQKRIIKQCNFREDFLNYCS